jgi:hypothetical protein
VASRERRRLKTAVRKALAGLGTMLGDINEEGIFDRGRVGRFLEKSGTPFLAFSITRPV